MTGLRSENSHNTLVNGKSRHARDNEGDLLVLRDPRVPYTEDPANTQTAKRRLEEDEAGFERATRRRLERTLHGLEAQVIVAQKRVDTAHASVRARADTRSICEQAVSEERAKRSMMEEYLKRQAQSVRPLLDEIVFQRAGVQLNHDAW